MYGYEGLGCIYWHMVAKLLLAVQEQALAALRGGAPAPVAAALVRDYRRIRDGLGFRKTAAEYGAFPTDPYSHTPRHAGAQQPGMTGQVKEEILVRFGELGVQVEDGLVRFRPELLERAEFGHEPVRFRCEDVRGTPRELTLPAGPRTGALAFTCCQVPVVYVLAPGSGSGPGPNGGPGPAHIRLVTGDGETIHFAGDRLDRRWSRALLERTGEIAELHVTVDGGALWSEEGDAGTTAAG
jgi:hypothetical protein